MPKENKRDIDDIPVNVKRSLEFIFVEHMDDVVKNAFVHENG
jgi:ATP-dependent Lon protease